MLATTEPLIHTIKGNLPVDSLRHCVEWTQSPEQVILVESYFLGDLLVKKSSHVCILTGVAATGEAATI